MNWFLAVGLTLGASVLAAQEPRPARSAESAGRSAPPRTSVHSYSERASRDLFTACDADSDDRLDLFEACEALESLEDPKDSEAFLRLDSDRDGFLSWPEFDHHLWSIVQKGGSLHVRPCRHLVDQAPERQEARAATPLQRFLRLHDANGNGGLDAPEIDQMVRRTGLPPAIVGQLRTLDHDQSGRIEVAELAPWFELLRGLVPEAGAEPPAPGGALPPPWRTEDLDADGRIDEAELTAMLRRLDPSLPRWAAHLLRNLDRNRDGALDATELPAVRRAARPGTSAAPSVRPAPTPAPSLAHAEPDR